MRLQGTKVTRTEFTSPTQSEKKTILEEDTHLDRNKVLRTTVDVDSRPEGKFGFNFIQKRVFSQNDQDSRAAKVSRRHLGQV